MYLSHYSAYTIADVTKVIAQTWTQLPQEDKEPYITRAASQRARYD
jgi:hypothetical protein